MLPRRSPPRRSRRPPDRPPRRGAAPSSPVATVMRWTARPRPAVATCRRPARRRPTSTRSPATEPERPAGSGSGTCQRAGVRLGDVVGGSIVPASRTRSRPRRGAPASAAAPDGVPQVRRAVVAGLVGRRIAPVTTTGFAVSSSRSQAKPSPRSCRCPGRRRPRRRSGGGRAPR